jgi:hypothetical protein
MLLGIEGVNATIGSAVRNTAREWIMDAAVRPRVAVIFCAVIAVVAGSLLAGEAPAANAPFGAVAEDVVVTIFMLFAIVTVDATPRFPAHQLTGTSVIEGDVPALISSPTHVLGAVDGIVAVCVVVALLTRLVGVGRCRTVSIGVVLPVGIGVDVTVAIRRWLAA